MDLNAHTRSPDPGCDRALAEAWVSATKGIAGESVVCTARKLCATHGTAQQQLEAELLELLGMAFYVPEGRLTNVLERVEHSPEFAAHPRIQALVDVVRGHIHLANNNLPGLVEATQSASGQRSLLLYPVLASLAIGHRTTGAIWAGEAAQALRCARQWVAMAGLTGLPHLIALATAAHGHVVSAMALEHRAGLCLLQQARSMGAGEPLSRWTAAISAHCLECMLRLGLAEQALDQLHEDLCHPGMARALLDQHALVARVFLANGRIADAEDWLGHLAPDQPAQPLRTWQWRLTKVLLLNARECFREAIDLAVAELARPKLAVPPAADRVELLRAKACAHRAVGDLRGADEAELQAQACIRSALADAAGVDQTGDAFGSPELGPLHAPQASEPVEGDAMFVRRQQGAHVVIAMPPAAAVPPLLARVSHEMRSPLAGVIGLVGLLERSPLNDRQRRWVSVLGQSSRWMLSMANDLLDLARIQSGQQVLTPAAVDWRSLLADTCALIEPLIGSKPVVLRWHCDPAVGDAWIGDPIRLRQVLHNLLSNAVKFTACGSVDVRVLEADRSSLRVEIQDTGRGIAPAAHERLFQAFAQAEPMIDTDLGSGLGLMLSRELVQQMGGRIGFISDAGHGSLFWFELPELHRAAPDRSSPA